MPYTRELRAGWFMMMPSFSLVPVRVKTQYNYGRVFHEQEEVGELGLVTG